MASRTLLSARLMLQHKSPRIISLRPVGALYSRRFVSTAVVKEGLSGDQQPPSLVQEIYKGEFARKLQWLRRVSFTSSVVSLIGIPTVALVGIGGGSVPLVGQVMIVGTALFTSLSSTAFLHLVTKPYCASLTVVSTGTSDEDRLFRATRVNIFGNIEVTEFTLKEATRITGGHPFASVQIKGQYFYIFGGKIDDVPIRRALTNEM